MALPRRRLHRRGAGAALGDAGGRQRHGNQEAPHGKKVAILAADGFELVGYAIPYAALKASGATVDVVSIHAGKIRGMNLTEPTRTVKVDRVLDLDAAAEYDAVLIVGGFVAPDFLTQSQLARGATCPMEGPMTSASVRQLSSPPGTSRRRSRWPRHARYRARRRAPCSVH